MKRNTIRMIALVLSLLLFTSSCSFTKRESPEDDEPADTGSIEYDLVGKAFEGFLFTGSSMTELEDEKYYLELRKDAVSLFNSAVALTAEAAFEASATLEKHEKLLFEYMDLIESDDYNAIGKITEGILVNRLVLNSLQGQFRLFSETVAEDDLAETEVKRYIFETVCELCARQKAYVSWLMGSTEVTTVLLQQTDADKADELIEDCVILYSDELKGDLTGMLSAYGRSVKIYSGITEADYLAGEYYLAEMKSKLEDMNPEARTLPMELYEELLAQDRKPPTVEQAPNGEDTLHEAISLLGKLEQDIDAGESSEMENMLFSNIILDTDKTNAVRDSFEKYITGSSSDLRTAIIHSAEIEQSSYYHPKNELTIQCVAIKSMESDMMFAVDSKTVGTEKVLNEEIQKDLIKQNIAAEEMEREAKSQLTKEQIIKMIKTAQNALNIAGFITGEQSRYPLMLTLLNGLIVKVGKLDNELIENLIGQLDKNLEELLGDEKQDLMDKLTDTKAEELIDAFTKWKDDTKNFCVLNYSKNDLIRLLNALGFYIPLEEVVIEVLDENTKAEEVQESVNWVGKLTYTESKSTFIVDGKDGDTWENSNIIGRTDILKFTIDYTGELPVCTYAVFSMYPIEDCSAIIFSVDASGLDILYRGPDKNGNHLNLTYIGTTNGNGTGVSGEFTEIIKFSEGYIRAEHHGTFEMSISK